MEWSEAVEQVTPHIVKITDPGGSGTGFLIARSKKAGVVGIATAAHVVKEAHDLKQPITVEHPESGQALALPPDQRAVFLDPTSDTAALMFFPENLPLPGEALRLIPEGRFAKVGTEVGWIGFPWFEPQRPCFFAGRVSCYRQDRDDYFIDGVVIHGVSGAPIVYLAKKAVFVIGLATAYIPNVAPPETLPGVALASNVKQFQSLVKDLKSIDEAKRLQGKP